MIQSSTLVAEYVDQDWPTLIPLESYTLPTIDTELLPAWLKDYALAVSEDTQTPPELAVGLMMATCSVAVARVMQVEVKPSYYEPCNTWFVVALAPGNRKSAVQKAATAPLMAWESEKAGGMEAEIKRVTSEVATLELMGKETRKRAVREKDATKARMLAEEAADIEARIPEIPKQPQLWTSDATPEKLGSMLADQGERMAWLSSEGGVFELLNGRYSNGVGNLDLVLKAHSGDTERVDRGSRPPVFLAQPLLTIGLSPQPEVLRGLATKPGFRGRGLLGRFLYLLPKSPLGYRTIKTNAIPEPVKFEYHQRIKQMLDWEMRVDQDGNLQPRTVKLSLDAKKEWADYFHYVESQLRPSGSLAQATDWGGKAPGAAIRLAGVLHAVEHAHTAPWDVEISGRTMDAALRLMVCIEAHSLAALELMGADPKIAAAKKVWLWIESQKRRTLSSRDIFEGVKGTHPKMAELREVLSILEERGYLEIVTEEKHGAGRKKELVIVRPQLAEAWQ